MLGFRDAGRRAGEAELVDGQLADDELGRRVDVDGGPTETGTQGLYEVTDAGLTVAVNVPVVASPAEMAEGCAEAKAVFEMFDTTDVEMVLALMQASEADSTENFTVESEGAPWAEATPQEQAQVIAAVNAAARGEC
ncbi:hypothetical protein GS471_05225 [Rhodococcus hoagii]|nr:hypothetical protein [Prescottella equi]